MTLKDWGRAAVAGALGRGVFPHQMSFLLDFPIRRLLLSPSELADRLHLSRNDRVLEVGCGSGFYSCEIARRVPDGHLQLFDLQPEMLEKARKKLEAEGLSNTGFSQGNACDPKFPDGLFDVVFLVSVLGEVSDASACLKSLRRILKPSGLLSVSEALPDPDFVSHARLLDLSLSAGFEFEERYGRRWNFTSNFRAPGGRA